MDIINMFNKPSYKLTQKEKKCFEQEAQKIREKDVIKVLTGFGRKLESVKKARFMPKYMASLIEDIQLLYEMLFDENYKISASTKRWIVLALLYVISPVDIIPDFIPFIGYADDAAVILFVIRICNDEINKYKDHLKTMEHLRKGGLILPLLERSGSSEIIITSGFLSEPWKVKSHTAWVENISRIASHSSISTFVWETREVADLFRVLTSGVVLNPLHPLSLGYKVNRIMEIWNNAKVNSALYAKVLLDDIDNLLSRSPDKKHISLIGHSLGSRLVFNAMQNAEKGMVQRIFFVGGAVGVDNDWQKVISLVDLIVNCYTSQDGVLKFLYTIAERGEKPIGLEQLDIHSTNRNHNIDCSAWVKGHTKYSKAAEHWFRNY